MIKYNLNTIYSIQAKKVSFMMFHKKDFLFILTVFTFCFILFFIYYISDKSGNNVFIYYNSELYTTVPLDKNTEIEINGTNSVRIENGYVYMSEASCPDKLCIKQGKINNSARSIICLPNKISVSVDKKSDIDAVSQ